MCVCNISNTQKVPKLWKHTHVKTSNNPRKKDGEVKTFTHFAETPFGFVRAPLSGPVDNASLSSI